MSDEFNIRDFRNAGASNGGQGEQSNRAFYSCVIASRLLRLLQG